ncbi:MAG TPA: hypothetical protein VF590_24230, partial [Isosphaeraceae bacterium]
MKSLHFTRNVACGLVAALFVVLAAGPADAGLFHRRPIVIVAPTTVVAEPDTTVYEAPVTTVTETRAVYSAPVVVRAPVATSYTTTTVVEAPVRAAYVVPAAPVV